VKASLEPADFSELSGRVIDERHAIVVETVFSRTLYACPARKSKSRFYASGKALNQEKTPKKSQGAGGTCSVGGDEMLELLEPVQYDVQAVPPARAVRQDGDDLLVGTDVEVDDVGIHDRLG